MKKEKFFILLSQEGDFLKRVDENTWEFAFYFDDATTFETRQEANEYLFEMSIRSICPDATVESILV